MKSYKIRSIADKVQTVAGDRLYKVHWVGFSDQYCSWLHPELLTFGRSQIHDFETSLGTPVKCLHDIDDSELVISTPRQQELLRILPTFINEEGSFAKGDTAQRIVDYRHNGQKEISLKVRWCAREGFEQPADSWVLKREAAKSCPAAFSRYVLMNL